MRGPKTLLEFIKAPLVEWRLLLREFCHLRPFEGSFTADIQTGQIYRLPDAGIRSLEIKMNNVSLLLAAQVLPTTLYVPIDGSPQGNLNEMNCQMPTGPGVTDSCLFRSFSACLRPTEQQF